MSEQRPITIAQLYPNLSAEELHQAEANLRRFAQVLADIYRERASRRVDLLTDHRNFPTIATERSTQQ